MKHKSASDERAKGRVGWFARMALQDALPKGGCLLCQALRTSVRRYLFTFLYEGMMSGDVRKQFLEGGGFCRLHFWQAKAIEEECWTEGFGVSILCENLLDRSTKDLESWTERGNRVKAGPLMFRRPAKKSERSFSLIPGSRCIAYAVFKSSEEHYLAALEELLDEPDFRDRYRDSQGLCLGHLQAATERGESMAGLETIKSRAQTAVRQLLGELREFQRKHDYRYKHEPRGSEWSSPQRAIEFLVGQKADVIGFEELRAALRSRSQGKPRDAH